MAKKKTAPAASTTNSEAATAKPPARRRRSCAPDRAPVNVLQIYANALEAEHKNKKKRSLMWLPGEDATSVGLPIPLVLQYIIDCGCYPLGCVIEVNGPPESCKTMFLYEIGRIFKESQGWVEMVLTEGKISQSLARSVIGWDAASRRAINPWQVRYMDDMQSTVLNLIDNAVNMAEKGIGEHKAFGHVAPVLIGIDSIMGANMKEKSDRIAKVGSAQRDFAIEALSLTTYLKELAGKIVPYPISVLLINHRKETESENPYEAAKVSKPGGKQLRFQASYEIVLHFHSKAKTLDTAPDGGLEIHHRYIRFDNGKNSAGTNNRAAIVRVSWRKRIINGQAKQITTWHWDEALVRLLTDWQDSKLPGDKPTKVTSEGGAAKLAGRKQMLDRFFHIRKETGPKFWSKTLGMTKSDAVSMSRMGRMITQNPDAVAAIQAAFGMTGSTIWTPGTDYQVVAKKVAKEAAVQAKTSIDDHMEMIMRGYQEASDSDIS